MLAFRSLDPFRALREPDPRRRDEKRPFPLRTKNCQHNPNNRLTGKAPYKFEYRVDSYLLQAIGSLGTDAQYHFTENFFVLKAGELGALTGTSVAAGASPTSAPPAGAVSPTPRSDGTSQASPQSGEVAPIGAFLAVIVVLGILVAVWRAHERAKVRRREIQFICEYFNLINASRRFPTADVPIVLEEREFGLLATPATLCEMRAHRATAGGRVRIAKGVRVGVRRYEYSYRQLDPIASGILVVTNRRVVFKSDERPVCQCRRENVSTGRSKSASRMDAKCRHGRAFAARQTG